MSNNSTKLITEMGPLVLFFITFKLYGLMPATAVIVIAMLASVIFTYIKHKKVAAVPLISTGLLVFFGLITVFTGDTSFIKLKPTILNLGFALILLVGVAFKKGLMKYIFSGTLQMKEKYWIDFSLRWAIFFLFLAGLNEVIWRNFSDDFWVNFKVFGLLPLTVLFTLTQMPFINKHKIGE